jgi:hypothetical protein
MNDLEIFTNDMEAHFRNNAFNDEFISDCDSPLLSEYIDKSSFEVFTRNYPIVVFIQLPF